jgi:DNA repair protein RecN (Recombination protein N)
MLVELSIQKLALIEESSLSFGPGLNVITGETGAGKSLLVGALELLLGQRPRPGLVRAGARQLVVEGRFVLPRDSADRRVFTWLEKHLPQVTDEWRDGEADDERELILGRTVAREGKSRAHVNHRPVTQKLLRDLAARLFEIHGQNEHQRLFEPSEQLRLLDLFGGLERELRDYRETRAVWLGLVDRFEKLERERKERRDRLDEVRSALAELDGARLDTAERRELVVERDLLRHAGSLKEKLGALVDEVSESESALLDRARRAERLLEQWSAEIEALKAPHGELAAAVVHLDEAARVLRTLAGRIELDPQRLESVEARLAEFERLERKYARGCDDLIALATELRATLAVLEADEQNLEQVGAQIAGARAKLLGAGYALRRDRKNAAGKLKKAVQHTLKDLGLPHAAFDVRLGQRASDEGELEENEPEHGVDTIGAINAIESDRGRFGERGMDRIEFLLAANPGEGLARLRDVASGGETARIMLALRSALVGADKDRTLVFDEIDAGVGGRLGPAIGEHLRRIGKQHQVLCVTHLPAIAAIASRHLRAAKSVHGGRTKTAVIELSGDARVEEIADMIAGGAAHETARAEARRLIGS